MRTPSSQDQKARSLHDDDRQGRFDRINVTLAIASLIVGSTLAVFGTAIYNRYVAPPSIESETLVGFTSIQFANTDNQEGEQVLRVTDVPFIVLNNVDGAERTIVEIRVVDRPYVETPRFEDYAVSSFWTRESCNSAAFVLGTNVPEPIGLPDLGRFAEFPVSPEPIESSSTPGEPYGLFVRFNNGDIKFVKVSKLDADAALSGEASAFSEAAGSITGQCADILFESNDAEATVP